MAIAKITQKLNMSQALFWVLHLHWFNLLLIIFHWCRYKYSFPFYRWENRGTESFSQITLLASGGDRVHIWQFDPVFCSPNHSDTLALGPLLSFPMLPVSLLRLPQQSARDRVAQKTEIYFSHFWSLASSRSKCCLIQLLMRAPFLDCRPSLCVPTCEGQGGGEKKGAL